MTVFDSMVEFLDVAYELKTDIVPCLVGPVGIGKTAAVLKHAENVNANNVVTIIASQILPNEVSGITMPDSETKAMEIYDHFRLSSLKDGDILFFDELLEADQLVLSACLTLIESRQLMSGRKLPDVQIVAATNPTIQPNVLKENIRQRFMFRKFGIDKQGCRKYIKDNIGIDVGDLVLQLQETGNEYNILTQRSLTKLAKWIMSVKEEDVDRTADVINQIWKSQIGTTLASCRRSNPHAEARKAIIDAVDNLSETICIDDIESMSIPDIVKELKRIGWWDDVAKALNEMNAPKSSDGEINQEINF